MKKILVIALIIPMIYSLTGCNNKQGGIHGKNQKIDHVTIYHSNGFGKINYKLPHLSFGDGEGIDIFQNILEKAQKVSGIVDMTEPKYDFVVIYVNGDKEGYHLWLGNKDLPSTIMNINDTNTIYKIPQELSDILKALILKL